MDNTMHVDFEQFMAVRLKASTDFIEGDFASLMAISVENEPATIFPPNGVCITGVDLVNDFNQQGASHFLPVAQNKFEIIHQSADHILAYWTGIQRSIVHLKGQYKPAVFNLRITEIFRKERGNLETYASARR